MDFFTFTITVVLSFLGILFGAVLSHYTKEEVLDMKKAIPFMQVALLIIIFLILFFYFPFYIVASLLVISFGFIYLFWKKVNLNFLDYIVLAMILVVSSLNKQAHLYVTLCVFLFGILSGALFYVLHSKKRNLKKIGHHKHSGKHLDFNSMTTKLFYTYKFFFILSILTFVFANIIEFFW